MLDPTPLVDITPRPISVCHSPRQAAMVRGQDSFVSKNVTSGMSPVALATLKNWRLKSKGGPDDLVFASRTGKPLSDGNLRRRVIYPTCDRLGVPRLSWHGFRHLHSSLLAYLGVPVSVAQAQLGHADPWITLETYTHLVSNAQRGSSGKTGTILIVPKLFPNRGATGDRNSELKGCKDLK